MFVEDLKNCFKNLGISKNDTIFVSSDISTLIYTSIKNKEKITPDDIINILIDLVGANGNLIFPTYNWDFCKGITFDYKTTPSKTGSLSQYALKRNDFIRTQHPIYSFAVYGKDAKYLASLDYKSSFGKDSIFSWFYQIGAKNLIINVSYQHSSTFVHYLEEKCSVKYRFLKNFTADYIDKEGNQSTRTYQMYVRPLDKQVLTTIDPMHELFVRENAVKEVNFNHSTIRLLDMKKAYDLVEDNIINHNSDRLAIFEV